MITDVRARGGGCRGPAQPDAARAACDYCPNGKHANLDEAASTCEDCAKGWFAEGTCQDAGANRSRLLQQWL